MRLLVREGSARLPELRLLKEDGTGDPWTKAGSASEEGPGYFVVPHAYWEDGYYTSLTVPGKAMFLLSLAETQDPRTPAFSVAYERMMEWYGISERTAERGFRELDSRAGVLLKHVRKVPDRRHPAGRREETWRALEQPFSTQWRAHLQAESASAVRGMGGGAS
mgnify:CR=1 FL=1